MASAYSSKQYRRDAAEVKRFAEWVTASPPRDSGGRVMAPGEIEQQTRADRRAHGIPLDDATWGQIVEAAQAVGVAPREVDRLASG